MNLRLNDEEQAVMNHILAAMEGIQRFGNGLGANGSELASAVHVLQGFVIQRMLSRLDADNWGDWYRGDSP